MCAWNGAGGLPAAEFVGLVLTSLVEVQAELSINTQTKVVVHLHYLDTHTHTHTTGETHTLGLA